MALLHQLLLYSVLIRASDEHIDRTSSSIHVGISLRLYSVLEAKVDL